MENKLKDILYEKFEIKEKEEKYLNSLLNENDFKIIEDYFKIKHLLNEEEILYVEEKDYYIIIRKINLFDIKAFIYKKDDLEEIKKEKLNKTYKKAIKIAKKELEDKKKYKELENKIRKTIDKNENLLKLVYILSNEGYEEEYDNFNIINNNKIIYKNGKLKISIENITYHPAYNWDLKYEIKFLEKIKENFDKNQYVKILEKRLKELEKKFKIGLA